MRQATSPLEGYDEVVAGLYRAAMGEEEWSLALKRMSDLCDIRGSQFVCFDHQNGALTYSQRCDSLPAEGEIEYVRDFFGVDPRIPLLLQREPGRWLWCQDEFEETRMEREPFYRDLLIPYGGRYSASMKISQNDEETVLFASLSRLDRGRFDDRQRDLLERLSRHLVQAIAGHRKIRIARRTAFIGAELIERLSRPVFVLRPDRTIEASNSSAADMLGGGSSPFRILSGRLHAVVAEMEQQITIAIMQLSNGLVTRKGDRFIRMTGRSAGDWLALSIAYFEPGKTLRAFGERDALLLTVHPREPASAPDPWMLQSALGLTRAEARVAIGIYGGATLKETALAIGVKESTVKSHLKSIFAKQGIEKQTDLVRIVSSLAS